MVSNNSRLPGLNSNTIPANQLPTLNPNNTPAQTGGSAADLLLPSDGGPNFINQRNGRTNPDGSFSVDFQRLLPEIPPSVIPGRPSTPDRVIPGPRTESNIPVPPQTNTTINTANPQGNTQPWNGTPEALDEQMVNMRNLPGGGVAIDMEPEAGAPVQTFTASEQQLNQLLRPGTQGNFMVTNRNPDGGFTAAFTGNVQVGDARTTSTVNTITIPGRNGASRTETTQIDTTTRDVRATVGVEANYGQLGTVNMEQFLRDPRSATRNEIPQDGNYSGAGIIVPADVDAYRANPEAYFRNNGRSLLVPVDQHGAAGEARDVTNLMAQLTPEQRAAITATPDGSFDLTASTTTTGGNTHVINQGENQVIPGDPGTPDTHVPGQPGEQQNLTYSVSNYRRMVEERERVTEQGSPVVRAPNDVENEHATNTPVVAGVDVTNQQDNEQNHNTTVNIPPTQLARINPTGNESTVNGVQPNGVFNAANAGRAVPLRTQTVNGRQVALPTQQVELPSSVANQRGVFVDLTPEDNNGGLFVRTNQTPEEFRNGSFGPLVRRHGGDVNRFQQELSREYGEGNVIPVPLDLRRSADGQTVTDINQLPVNVVQTDTMVQAPGIPGGGAIVTYGDRGRGNGTAQVMVPREGADPAQIQRFFDTSRSPGDRAVDMSLFEPVTDPALAQQIMDMSNNLQGLNRPTQAAGFPARVDANGQQTNLERNPDGSVNRVVQGRGSEAPVPTTTDQLLGN